MMTFKQELITLTTSDGVKIVGDFVRPAGALHAALLLHMMPATRVSWKPLVEALTAAGIASLAIDLRGHGESTALGQDPNDIKAKSNNVRLSLSKPTLNYKNFSDAEHQASRLDTDAAINFLKQKGFDEGAIALVGASIGANLSLDALVRYAGTQRAVLLSPGLDYRGVKTEPPMRSLGAAQKVWLVAAEEDAYSAESVRTLHKLQNTQSTLTVFNGTEHGTSLFATQPNLVSEIVKFLT